MMNRDKKIQEEIEKTMQQLEEIERIESNPYFYTKLQTKIESQSEEAHTSILEVLTGKMLRPVLLTIIILANVISVVVAFNANQEIESTDSYITAFAEEYSLDQENTELFNLND